MHEAILRLVVEGDDGDDNTMDTVPAQTARQHIDLLKQSHLRLKGWDKRATTYKDLVDAVIEMYKHQPEFKSTQGIDAWNFNKEKPSDALGKFVAPTDWSFAEAEELAENNMGDGQMNQGGLRRPGMGVKRSTSYWGMSEEHRVLHGMPVA